MNYHIKIVDSLNGHQFLHLSCYFLSLVINSPVLPPEPVIGPGVAVAVRVEEGGHVPVHSQNSVTRHTKP